MNIKMNFHQMPHSDGIEQHAKDKMQKIASLFKKTEATHPLSAEFFLNAHPSHAHHDVELRVKSNYFSLASHDSGADMYMAIDSVIEKMLTQVKKEKERLDDKHHKVITEKNSFGY